MSSEENQRKAKTDKSQQKQVVCPTCNGSGHVKLGQLPPIDSGISYKDGGSRESSSEKKAKKTPNTIKLPLIKQPQTNASKESARVKTSNEKTFKKMHPLKPQSAHSAGDTASGSGGDFMDLLPPPKQLKNPNEAIKYALGQLGNSNWENVVQGIGTLVQVSRTHSALLEPYMNKVNQTLCEMLHNMRSQVARYACQASKEFFRTMQCTARPEFDEIVSSLLHRTADTNRFIRHDANDALDSMVTYIPPVYSVRAVVDKGPIHKNALVRTAAARVLVCIVTIIDVHVLFTVAAYKETRKRVFDAAATLMNDPNMSTRNTAKQLFEMFVMDDNFDSLFYAETDKRLVKKVDRSLVLLRYKNQK